jgi:hypothetical protein
MSKTQELIDKLNIPAGTAYPIVDFNVDGNVFAIISAVSKAWRPINRDVSNNIMNVVNEHCGSYEEALRFLMAISNVSYDSDNDDLGGLEEDFPDTDSDEE